MRNINEDNITQAVIAAMSQCSNDRLRTVMTSLVQHLHSFARDVHLTEDEWFAAISFLTEVGHITDERRQEFVLLSDTLGLSMLVTTQNNRKPAECTEATVLGPFFVPQAPRFENGEDISNGAAGAPCFVSGRVRGLDGAGVPHATLDVWQSDEDGFYDVQLPPGSEGDIEPRARAQLQTDADGRFHFRSILAEAYPIPYDGPVGQMLDALGRHPWRPAHLHFWIQADGHEPLITHIFRNHDQYLDSDAVFGVRSTLIVDWLHHEPGVAPDGTKMDVPFYTVEYEFVLNPLGAHA
ncbi:intradiol ring-cleavage dioxygenase [Paraburkholderia fungorum]|uniref:Hydroxyquinol 1,2-dioxygenase n=1 Tax=Paraburkholderia fungorum TaxID=134537 RepID=A0A420GY48_9BURK|nr:intradiol ring-cleavage dioxygenase [Paraburkholderia fungorum]RKF50137.1 hydroxyquinol 1,2-dioxygenase [Paraburkholderia fungorum]